MRNAKWKLFMQISFILLILFIGILLQVVEIYKQLQLQL